MLRNAGNPYISPFQIDVISRNRKPCDLAADLDNILTRFQSRRCSFLRYSQVLDHFVVAAPWDDLADRLTDRYGGVADRLVAYLGGVSIERDPSAVGRWGEIARALRS